MGEAVVIGGLDRGLKTGLAKALRKQAPCAERALWPRLRARRLRGFKFRRQAPIGRFVVDFVCFEGKLVVELDGPLHDEARDDRRDQFLRGEGFRVLRFKNERIFCDQRAVLQEIINALLPAGEKVARSAG